MTPWMTPFLRAARRAATAKGQSVRSQYFAISSALATVVSFGIASSLSAFYEGPAPYVAGTISMALLLPAFRLIAIRMVHQESKGRLPSDLVGLDEQIEDDYDAELFRIEQLDVGEEKKQQLRIDAYQEQKLRRATIRGVSSSAQVSGGGLADVRLQPNDAALLREHLATSGAETRTHELGMGNGRMVVVESGLQASSGQELREASEQPS